MNPLTTNKAVQWSGSVCAPQTSHVATFTTQIPNPREADYEQFVDGRCEPGFNENAEVHRTFGRPGIQSQGAAGSRVCGSGNSQRMRFEESEVSFDYMDDLGEAPPDSAGPLPALDISMEEEGGSLEASEAVARARREGKSTSEIFDEMEAAEAVFQAQEVARQVEGMGKGVEARFLHKLQQQGQPGSPGALTHLGDSSLEGLTPASPRGHQGGVTEATRQHVVDRIAESLRAAAAGVAGSGDSSSADVKARECEEALFNCSHSKSVYLSLASNAVRAARSVDDVAELVRVACGKPKEESGEGQVSPYTTGLQGYILKPEY